MMRFTHVLVAVDFSETTEDVLDVAVAMAAKFDAKLTLAHAFYIYPIAATDDLYVPPEPRLREARAKLEDAVSGIRRRHPNVDGAFVRGEPGEEILHLAAVRGADFIVVGTHGRRWLSHLFLGSVAEKIGRRSTVPVVTVSARADVLDTIKPKDLRPGLPGTTG